MSNELSANQQIEVLRNEVKDLYIEANKERSQLMQLVVPNIDDLDVMELAIAYHYLQ